MVNRPFGSKEICEYREPETQLRNLDPDTRKAGLGYIFSRVAILSGFKGEIPEINKEDITDLLLTRFKTISLNELSFAFKIDRHGYHGDPTPHFQLFNAEYVTKVLNRYLKYKELFKNRPNQF
ncbi:hypothetical protein [Formosa haliotis]|uniref:hypothetical protein n=1 Tax=Formosa haliotis TaxID=1555194 RepID=UPI0013566D6B|nr:hypothetical protein [Formosa haliotis]